MLKNEKKQKKPTDSFDIKISSHRQSEKPKKALLAAAFGPRTQFDNQPRPPKHFIPTGNIPSKLSPRLNLSKTIKSISKEPKKGYIPALTENVEIYKYNHKTNHNHNIKLANTDKVRISHKEFGIIKAYAAITNEGRRDYNEDRVSIIYNISKPQNFIETQTNKWPKCSFFGLYDGHGGNGCADYLRDNLHNFIISEPHFPSNPQKALVNGFIKAEKNFIRDCEKRSDFSGSCAIVVLIIEKRCYVANVGDSRAILSGNNGIKTYALSRDHRPGDEKEYTRILQAGGKIYQTEYENKFFTELDHPPNHIIGPLRVQPGKLSVSRTIGDIEAKDPKYGGNPNVVISTPEIKYFDITENFDFICIGCDGIFEKMKNKQIVDIMWNTIGDNEFPDIHNLSGVCLEKGIEECLKKESTDNLTMIMVCLKEYEKMKNNESNEYYAAQTENIEPVKQKVGQALKGQNKIQRQPLSVLLTKLVHSNTGNHSFRKVANINNTNNTLNNI